MPSLTQYPPITLHLGAHRTATSSLQRMLDRDAVALNATGIAIWGPKRTRTGLLTGVMGDPGRREGRRDVQARRAAGRVSMQRADLAADGVQRLVISDENMLGGLRENVLLGRLYPTVAARLHRLSDTLPGVGRVCLSLRSPDAWWTSVFAFLMTRGFAPPDRATLDAILQARRGWRDVIHDVAGAFPDAELVVWSYEDFGAKPETAYQWLTGLPPQSDARPMLNGSLPIDALRARLRDEGHATELPGVGQTYAPFTPDERQAMRDAHRADLDWLRNGADGLANYQSATAIQSGRRDRKGMRHGRGREAQVGATG